jgi:hypothetical protein
MTVTREITVIVRIARNRVWALFVRTMLRHDVVRVSESSPLRWMRSARPARECLIQFRKVPVISPFNIVLIPPAPMRCSAGG